MPNVITVPWRAHISHLLHIRRTLCLFCIVYILPHSEFLVSYTYTLPGDDFQCQNKGAFPNSGASIGQLIKKYKDVWCTHQNSMDIAIVKKRCINTSMILSGLNKLQSSVYSSSLFTVQHPNKIKTHPLKTESESCEWSKMQFPCLAQATLNTPIKAISPGPCSTPHPKPAHLPPPSKNTDKLIHGCGPAVIPWN